MGFRGEQQELHGLIASLTERVRQLEQIISDQRAKSLGTGGVSEFRTAPPPGLRVQVQSAVAGAVNFFTGDAAEVNQGQLVQSITPVAPAANRQAILVLTTARISGTSPPAMFLNSESADATVPPVIQVFSSLHTSFEVVDSPGTDSTAFNTVYCNIGGVFVNRSFEIGAANSGGAGFRLLRIAN